jgi:hypothetical protein
MRSVILAPFVFLAAASVATAVVLRGKVLDSSSDKPLSSALVEELSTHMTAMTDAAGVFTLEVAAGPLELAVSHTGYRVVRLTLAAPTVQPLAVRLDPVISIADRVEVTAARAREGTDPVSFTNLP